jgi:hypothetical protein
MTSKLTFFLVPKKTLKSYFKFVFLTKQLKEKYQHTLLKLFLNAIIKNIKLNNIFDIIEVSKSMKTNKYNH